MGHFFENQILLLLRSYRLRVDKIQETFRAFAASTSQRTYAIIIVESGLPWRTLLTTNDICINFNFRHSYIYNRDGTMFKTSEGFSRCVSGCNGVFCEQIMSGFDRVIHTSLGPRFYVEPRHRPYTYELSYDIRVYYEVRIMHILTMLFFSPAKRIYI